MATRSSRDPTERVHSSFRTSPRGKLSARDGGWGMREGGRATTHSADDERWMGVALDEARAAQLAGEVPVGAVIVREGEALARAGNQTVRDQDPTSHAEALV